MPLYDFKCEKCELLFEVERPLAATGPAKCPGCGSTKTSKVFSAAGIVFKGGGFYVTDSKTPPSGGTGSKPVEKTSESAKKDSGATPESSTNTTSSDGKKSKSRE